MAFRKRGNQITHGNCHHRPNPNIKPMRTALVFAAILGMSGCATMNMFGGSDAFCREISFGLSGRLDQQIEREAAGDPPQGALTQAYSRELWDEYWNERVYYIWPLGAESCGGTYTGPPGPEIIRSVLEKRRDRGLPDIEIEQRNHDKPL